MKELIIIIILATTITVAILFGIGAFNKGNTSSNVSPKNTSETKVLGVEPDNPKEVRKKYNIPPNDNYILPQEFKIGLIKQDKPYFMNNCNPNVLYPINGLGPDYGWKMPDNCPCTEFVQAP
jgi:hypothetical protein